MIWRDLAIKMACVRLFAFNFTNRLETYVFIVLSDKNNLFAISLLDNPSEMLRRTSYSRLVISNSSIFFWLIIGKEPVVLCRLLLLM